MSLSAAVSQAQTSWKTVGTGAFTEPANWTGGVPTSLLDTQIINGTLATPTVVNLTGVGSVANLTLGAYNTFNANTASQLHVFGTAINNGGVINILGGSGFSGYLALRNSISLSGGGTLTLNSGDTNGTAYLRAWSNGLTFTNVDNTIQGYGVIGNGGTLTFVNQSIVNANSNGNGLTLDGTLTVTNTGTLKATSGGTLNLATGGTLTNTGGTITAGTASTVNIGNGTSINGGTLTTIGTGVLGTSGSAGLKDVTLSAGSTYSGRTNTTTNLSGSINNLGNFQVNAGGGFNDIFAVTADTTLTGGGTFTLNSGDNNGQSYLRAHVNGLTLTNVDNTIQGYGVIGTVGHLAFVNQSIVDANSNANILTLDGTLTVTNTGTLKATNGGTINIFSGGTLENTGGTITAGVGSMVNIGNAVTINGGTLSTVGTGVMGTSGTASLNNVTLSSGSTYTGRTNTTTNLSGSISNQGNFQMNAGGGFNDLLVVNGNTNLTGGGTITLNSGDNNGQAYLRAGANGLTLTNVDNTIQGYGVVGTVGHLTFVNQSTVNANSNANTLVLDGTLAITNTGTLKATNNGTLQISATVDNHNGNIVSDGGAVNIFGSTIKGGTLSGTGLKTTSNATFDGSTASGAVTFAPGSVWTSGPNTQTYVNGSIVNHGAFQLNAGGGFNNTLGLNGITSLTGGGTITLNSGDNNGAAIIQQQVGSLTLTNTDNTIQGYGIIGNGALTFVNQSTVNANSSGNTLWLNASGGVTNTGTLEATNNGTLLVNTNVDNHNGSIASNGGTVNFVGSTIKGGTLSGAGLGTTSFAVLDGSTGSGAITFAPGSVWTSGTNTQTYVNGSIVNHGAFQLNAGGGTNNSFGLTGNTNLTGGGTITLSSGDNNGRAIIQQQVGSLTLTNTDNTIRGYGLIGNGALTFVNGSAGTVLADAVGQTMQINASGGLTNHGTLQTNAGSALQVTAPLTNFSGNTLTEGTYIVNGAAGNTGTFQLSLGSNTGGEIVNNAAAIVLNGPTANTRFIDSNGHEVLSSLAANSTAASSLTVKGGYTFTTAGAFSNAGTVHAGDGGTFNASHAITGPTGTVQIDSGGNVSIAAGSTSSTVGTLTQNGTLALGSNNITVSTAYNNANFGTGNSFNNHANVTGSGSILAAPNTAIALTGSAVGGGSSATPTLENFGSVHVGDSVTRNFSIQNSGASGPQVLGAIQTSVNGGNITDARLSGSGVTAGNFGPLNAGQSTSPYAVTFTASSAGALASGQTIHIATNFDNVQGPTLTLGGGAAYQLAQANTLSTPVNLGNVRVGDALGSTLHITNTAPGTGGYTENLGASVTSTTGGVTTVGSVSGLAAGASSNAISAALNTSTAGAKSGTATVGFASTEVGGSGLGTTGLGSQTVTLNGAVYRLAEGSVAPNPVVINAREGTVATSALTASNVAVADGYSEGLRASAAGSSGTAGISGNTGLIAAGSSGGGLSVSLDTSSAGAKAGTATVHYVSDGSGTSGLAPISAGDQVINVTGGVYRAAQAGTISPNPVNLGNVHVGDTLGTTLGVSNTAAASGGYTETLGATVTGATGGVTTSGSVSGLAAGANSNAISAGFNTATAGAKSGTATVGFTSTEVNGSGLGTIGVGSQNVTLSGGVYRLAEASLGDITFGNVLVGSSQTRYVSVSNTALNDLFSEGLDASLGNFSGASASLLSGAGSITNLAAGSTNNTTLAITLNTSTSGVVTANVQVLLNSNGATTSGLGLTALPSQLVPITGQIEGVVGNLASANAASPNPINLGNVRVGDSSPTQAISLTNTAVGPAEGLNASIGTASPGLTASGSFDGLSPGSTNNSGLVVGMNTATAGNKSGTATISLASDGTFNSGVPTTLSPQNVNVTGGVYRLAEGSVTPNPVVINAREGAVASTALTASNLATADGYSEGLRASSAGSSGAAAISGSSGLIAAGSSGSGLFVSLDTSTAGAKTGTASVHYVSDGLGTSGLSPIGAGDQTVNVTGGVYRAAVADALPATINLGTMRTGTVVDTALSVSNIAGSTGGYTETLGASFGTTSAGLVGTGNISGLETGATSNALAVQYTAGAAGAYSGNAKVNFASQEINGSGLGTLALDSQSVVVTANVNALAALGLHNTSGFTFTETGANSATLDFGILTDPSLLAAVFELSNSAVGPADSLLGELDLTGLNGSPFSVTGDYAFDLIGGALLPIEFRFDPNGVGAYSATFTFDLASHNPFQTDLSLGNFAFTLRGEVRGGPSVPESTLGILPCIVILATLVFGRRFSRSLTASSSCKIERITYRL